MTKVSASILSVNDLDDTIKELNTLGTIYLFFKPFQKKRERLNRGVLQGPADSSTNGIANCPQARSKSGHKKELATFVTSSNYLLMMERVGFEIEVQLYEIIIENIFYFQNVIFYTPKYAQNF